MVRQNKTNGTPKFWNRRRRKKLAIEMQERRPLDVLSTDFADWQTDVETSRFGNDRYFLEICYEGIERMTNKLEVE